MLGPAVLQRLAAMLPDFAAHWRSPNNMFAGDTEPPTLCGAFAALTEYLRVRASELTPGQVSELGAFITECMSEPGTALDEAAATCLLENVAHEPVAEILTPHLSGHALRFLREQ